MRVLFPLFALFPIFAAAQDLGTYQITSGTISNGGEVSGNGFTGEVYGGPEILSFSPDYYGGPSPPLNFCFGCGLPGTDAGVGSIAISGLNDPALAGLVQVFGYGGFAQTGELTVAPIIDNVTSAGGTFTAPFTMSADLVYGPPGATIPGEYPYVNFVGHGTVTLDLAPPPPALCSNNGVCDPFAIITSLQYTFAPELDPASLSGALTLLGAGLLVIRGRRSRTPLS